MDATLCCTWLGSQVTALLDEGEVLDIDDTRKHAESETPVRLAEGAVRRRNGLAPIAAWCFEMIQELHSR